MPSDQDVLNYIEATDRGRMFGGDGPGFDPLCDAYDDDDDPRNDEYERRDDGDDWMPLPGDGDGEDD